MNVLEQRRRADQRSEVANIVGVGSIIVFFFLSLAGGWLAYQAGVWSVRLERYGKQIEELTRTVERQQEEVRQLRAGTGATR